MTREEAFKIIKDEKIAHYNIYGDHPHRANEICINKEGGMWVVYTLDEREGINQGSQAYFRKESDAWDNFIYRLRLLMELKALCGGRLPYGP